MPISPLSHRAVSTTRLISIKRSPWSSVVSLPKHHSRTTNSISQHGPPSSSRQFPWPNPDPFVTPRRFDDVALGVASGPASEGPRTRRATGFVALRVASRRLDLGKMLGLSIVNCRALLVCEAKLAEHVRKAMSRGLFLLRARLRQAQPWLSPWACSGPCRAPGRPSEVRPSPTS